MRQAGGLAEAILGLARVRVVADDPLVRTAISVMLEREGLELVLDDAEVDVRDLGGHRGALAPFVRPTVALVDSPRTGEGALAAGARGVLPRDVAGDALAAAVLTIRHGLLVLDRTLAPLPRPQPASDDVQELTPRESEVLQLLAGGLSNKEIAARLAISEHTVKFHVNAVLAKLDADSRTEAVVRGVRLGLVIL